MDRVFRIVKSYLKKIADHKNDLGSQYVEEPSDSLKEIILKVRKNVKFHIGYPSIDISYFYKILGDEELTDDEYQNTHKQWFLKVEQTVTSIFGSGRGTDTEIRGDHILFHYKNMSNYSLGVLQHELTVGLPFTEDLVDEKTEEYEGFLKKWIELNILIKRMLSREYLQEIIEEVRSTT